MKTSYKDRWWYSTTTILILMIFSVLIIPAMIAIGLWIVQMIKRKKYYESIREDVHISKKISDKKSEINNLDTLIKDKQDTLANKEKLLLDLRTEFDKSVEEERLQLLTNTQKKGRR